MCSSVHKPDTLLLKVLRMRKGISFHGFGVALCSFGALKETYAFARIYKFYRLLGLVFLVVICFFCSAQPAFPFT